MHPNTIRAVDNQIQASNSLTPRHPFSCSMVGPRGCSKSTVLINMLTNPSIYRGYFHKIIVMSASIRLDPKWSNLANERGVLARGSNDTDDSAIDLTGSRTQSRRFTGKLDPDLMFHEYRQDVLETLIREQEDGFTRYGDNMDRVLLIIDDAPALDVFSTKKDNLYNKLAVYLRHVRTSCIQVTQNYKSMPRILRNNQSNILLFRTENIGELKK